MNDYAEGFGLTRDRMVYLWDQYLNGNADDKILMQFHKVHQP